ncbi:MAG: hypothetical protein QMB71_05885 [Tolumonas sp.]
MMVLTRQRVILVFSGVLPIWLYIIDIKPFFFLTNPTATLSLAGFAAGYALCFCFCASIAPISRPLH